MKLELFGLTEIPLVIKGEDIDELILSSLKKQKDSLKNGDIILIAETLISKAEGNYIDLKKINPSSKAKKLAEKSKKDPKLVESIINESKEIIAVGPDFIISETKHGFVCANAGIDESNVEEGLATPMPIDPDKSAKKIYESLKNKTGKNIGVIITDTQGRAFRNGAVGVAIGCIGISPIWKRIGEKDLYGRELQTTEIGVADELAAAASLLMGQANEGVPIVIIRGFENFDKLKNTQSNIKPLIREKEFDVFRN
ncbi:F420-0:L-glutamate ligase [Methanobrevibacter arboriphilus JCM 13429 = DSM 1125]|uniref:Coenzyme F420:L-glutamate ligase n=1 Tax=Methanobrevibacter arboriphilus JCM 13429 = DSM 1125 TaxID=1300164 RepID=A0A1V6N0J8_METAZ|nr:coenzyme F420-0:L-glutamate ligase [Methanobrevibacter arboriphilus]OQD58127.1 F420-0:L-glutamate ligase [Methanobrevibacter arboriphilus JCM 13429 = DSM 1125]